MTDKQQNLCRLAALLMIKTEVYVSLWQSLTGALHREKKTKPKRSKRETESDSLEVAAEERKVIGTVELGKKKKKSIFLTPDDEPAPEEEPPSSVVKKEKKKEEIYDTLLSYKIPCLVFCRAGHVYPHLRHIGCHRVLAVCPRNQNRLAGYPAVPGFKRPYVVYKGG